MASLRIVKRRIKSAKNISQVTKALQMVSAVKMRKAQEAALAGKPYANEIRNVLSDLSGRVEKDLHPFLTQPEEIKKITVVVIGTEKGLAGSLVTNLARKVFNLKQQIEAGKLIPNEETDGEGIVLAPGVEVSGVSWGKKAQDILRKTGWPIVADFSTKTREPLEDMIRTLNNLLTETYLSRGTDMVIIVYSNFVNTMTQKPTVVQFLPMTSIHQTKTNGTEYKMMIQFEPSPQAVLGPLLEHYLKVILTQIVFDGQAAEHSARMVAMKNANDNAKEIIKALTVTYNQTRQSIITNEIADIVSGSISSV